MERMTAGGSLERNAWVGLRTGATTASDEAWTVAHRAARPMVRKAWVLGVAWAAGIGVALILGAFPDAVSLFPLAGTLAVGALTVWAGVIAHRAASRL